MIVKEMQKAYCAPKAKVVELGIMSVLCGSQDGFSSTGTEQLEEEDISGNIWKYED